MTGTEVIKAFERCIKNDIFDSACKTCDFQKVGFNCMDALFEQVHALLNCQQAELARWESLYKPDATTEEILNKYSNFVVKEFAEKLKEEQEFHTDECDRFVGFVAVSRIDNLLKEMGVE